MLLIENKKGMKVYTIKNKYLCECGVLNEENVYVLEVCGDKKRE